MTEDKRVEAAIASVKAAFEPGATADAKVRGEQVLSALLAALRGSMQASPSAAASSTAIPVATAGPLSGVLDHVIGFLKEQLDDEDRAAVESEAAACALPFINSLPRN